MTASFASRHLPDHHASNHAFLPHHATCVARRLTETEETMHANMRLLDRFYRGVQDHDHQSVAACYHPNATFKDIAFDLSGKKMIYAMWHMIAGTDLRIKYNVEQANETTGSARWHADYTFRDTGRKVHNKLSSTFQFRDGLILGQVDDCNALRWGIQALGPARGFGSCLIPSEASGEGQGKAGGFYQAASRISVEARARAQGR